MMPFKKLLELSEFSKDTECKVNVQNSALFYTESKPFEKAIKKDHFY